MTSLANANELQKQPPHRQTAGEKQHRAEGSVTSPVCPVEDKKKTTSKPYKEQVPLHKVCITKCQIKITTKNISHDKLQENTTMQQ